MTEGEVIDLLLQASGITRERFNELLNIIKTDDAGMNRIMKAQWNAKPRRTASEIAEYYRSSDVWFVNEWNHGKTSLMALATGDTSELSPGQWLAPFIEHVPKGSLILDYGGGLWNGTACLALSGYPVVQAEISGPVTRFLEMFRHKSGMEGLLKVLSVDSEFPLTEEYAAVSCFEVLEHLLHPKEFMVHLRDHLKPGGTFASSVSFSEPDYAPYHMHAALGEPGVWDSFMKEIGFELKSTCADSGRKVWRKP